MSTRPTTASTATSAASMTRPPRPLHGAARSASSRPACKDADGKDAGGGRAQTRLLNSRKQPCAAAAGTSTVPSRLRTWSAPEAAKNAAAEAGLRTEEHTSELPSLMRISSAVYCLKKTNEQLRR